MIDWDEKEAARNALVIIAFATAVAIVLWAVIAGVFWLILLFFL